MKSRILYAVALVNVCGLWPLIGAAERRAFGLDDGALPIEVRQSLESQGKELSPISVSWQEQMKSVGQSDLAALKQLNSDFRDPAQFFAKTKHTVKWQDGKLYDHREIATEGGVLMVGETAFDGSIRFFGQHNPSQKTLGKHFGAKLKEKEPEGKSADTGYFDNAAVHVPHLGKHFGAPKVESLILHLLDESAELISARSIETDDKTAFVIELLVDNPIRQTAQKYDLAVLKKDLASSRETPETQHKILKITQDQRELPEKIRMIFYLDPTMNYAVRQWEHWNGTKSLLRRGTCSNFVEIDHRGVWLPQSISVEIYEFFTRPGFVSETPVLEQEFVVTELAVDRISDEQFTLNYTDPGTLVWDGTTPAALRSPGGLAIYTIGGALSDFEARVRESRAKTPNRWWVFINASLAIGIIGVLLYRLISRIPKQISTR